MNALGLIDCVCVFVGVCVSSTNAFTSGWNYSKATSSAAGIWGKNWDGSSIWAQTGISFKGLSGFTFFVLSMQH